MLAQPAKYGTIILTQSSDGVNMHVSEHPRTFDDTFQCGLHQFVGQFGIPTTIQYVHVTSAVLLALELMIHKNCLNSGGALKLSKS